MKKIGGSGVCGEKISELMTRTAKTWKIEYSHELKGVGCVLSV